MYLHLHACRDVQISVKNDWANAAVLSVKWVLMLTSGSMLPSALKR